jgi:hypothetical protein
MKMQAEGTMLETLAGRLTWERRGESIRVAIPARAGQFAVIYGPVVVVWLVIATIRYVILLSSSHPDDTNFILQMIAMGIYILGVFYFVWWLAWTLTGETILTLDPVEMNIQRRVLGIELDTRCFRCESVERLMFVRPGKSESSFSIFDLGSGRIQFRANNSIHRFARGILEDEANALIEQMLKRLQFPRNTRPGALTG